MTDRRDFVLQAGTVAAATLLGGQALARHAGAPGQEALARLMQQRLAAQLGDASTAADLVPPLEDVGFDWQLPQIPIGEVDSIVAYAFGNRPNAASGNTASDGSAQAALPDPGPINAELAEVVAQIHRMKPARIYVQWEIARFLVSRHGLDPLQFVSIEPLRSASGQITYLSTDGVAQAIVKQAGHAATLGKVAVVGHRDHAKRCILTSRACGMDAYTATGVDLPVNYDPLSGQPWTRDREIYLVHDMFAQLIGKTQELISGSTAHG